MDDFQNPNKKKSSPVPGTSVTQGVEVMRHHTELPPVTGVPLYDEDVSSDTDQTTKDGTSRFVIQGYQDLWAAVVFLLTLLMTVVLGSYSFSENLHYIATHNMTTETRTDRNGRSHYRTKVTETSTDPNAKVEASELLIIAGFVTIAAAGAGFLALMLLAKYARQAIIGCNLAISAMYVVTALALFASGTYWGGVLCLVVAGLQLLWLYLVRSRIPFATLLLKLSARLVMKYKASIVASFASVAVFYFYAIFYASMSFPVSSRAAEGKANGLDGFLSVFYLLCFFWTAQVVMNVLHVTIAGLVATWYFCGDGHMPPNPTKASFKRAITTSFGSICFGSLLVAIVKTLRHLARSQRGHDNDFVRCVMECLLACLERMMEYFNVYAFIHVAIYGCGYIEAAKRTWRLAQENFFSAYFNDCLIEPTVSLVGLGVGLSMGFFTGIFLGAPMGILTAVVSVAVVLIMLRCIESAVPTIFVCFAEMPEALLNSSSELYHMLHAADQGIV